MGRYAPGPLTLVRNGARVIVGDVKVTARMTRSGLDGHERLCAQKAKILTSNQTGPDT